MIEMNLLYWKRPSNEIKDLEDSFLRSREKCKNKNKGRHQEITRIEGEVLHLITKGSPVLFSEFLYMERADTGMSVYTSTTTLVEALDNLKERGLISSKVMSGDIEYNRVITDDKSIDREASDSSDLEESQQTDS